MIWSVYLLVKSCSIFLKKHPIFEKTPLTIVVMVSISASYATFSQTDNSIKAENSIHKALIKKFYCGRVLANELGLPSNYTYKIFTRS